MRNVTRPAWRPLVWLVGLGLVLLVGAACGGSSRQEMTPVAPGEASFREHVQPILLRNCVGCHGGAAGLWLDRYERIMEGSIRGPVIEPGNPEESELYLRITGKKRPAMPPGKSLSSVQIDAIRDWIEQGAPDN